MLRLSPSRVSHPRTHLQFIQHVVDLLAVELLMQAIERSPGQDVVIVGVVALKNDWILQEHACMHDGVQQ